jgi:hypothetical protein
MKPEDLHESIPCATRPAPALLIRPHYSRKSEKNLTHREARIFKAGSRCPHLTAAARISGMGTAIARAVPARRNAATWRACASSGSGGRRQIAPIGAVEIRCLHKRQPCLRD